MFDLGHLSEVTVNKKSGALSISATVAATVVKCAALGMILTSGTTDDATMHLTTCPTCASQGASR